MVLKRIPMDGPQNFRDIGGFLNKENKCVAWGKLYRADGLNRLSEEDIRKMQERNIRTIVDLRSLGEQKENPDVVPEGVTYYSCPMMREELTNVSNVAEHSFTRSMVMGYQTMLKDGADLIGKAVCLVMEHLEQGAVVFHCTAGKDRTGILAAVLLLVLGIREEDIIADYQVSHTYNEEGVNRIMEQVPQLREYLESAGEESMLHSHPKNMKAVLELLHTENIKAWLESYGVPAELQERFRDTMLVQS